MAQAAGSSDSLPETSTENNFQPFFVLHKASPPRKPAAKARRRIELSPKAPGDVSSEDQNENLRFEAFKTLWGETDSAIKEVLRNSNAEVFDKIGKWIRLSFDEIRACQMQDLHRNTLPHPKLSDASSSTSVASRQIFTALLYTKNMEFVDDILTYVDLGQHLRSCGYHVANLTSLEFTAKNGVGGCLKTLVRQFLTISVDAPDMSVLASWYAEQGKTGEPMVVIIDDVERCCSSVLADFIMMLREWCIKVPIILILGVATTFHAVRSIMPSNTSSCLSLSEFTLGTPSEKMTAIVEAVLIENCDNFSIGKKVSSFLRNYFLKHDGTVTFFVRALKIAMLQHVYMEPLSSGLMKIGEEYKPNATAGDGACGLRKIWSTIVMCLYDVGKSHKVSLLDIYCDMLEPDASDHNQLEKDNSTSSCNHYLQKGGSVYRATQIVRSLPAGELSKLLRSWEVRTSGVTEMKPIFIDKLSPPELVQNLKAHMKLASADREIHAKVAELQSLNITIDNQSKKDMTIASKRSTSRNNINDVMDEAKMRERVATLLEHTVRDYLLPTGSVHSNERLIFNNVPKLQAALTGDPRKRIQADLLESYKFLKCSCCSKNISLLLPSMHDTSILYTLAQEHGDIINVHEWFNSFKAIVSPQKPQTKKKLKLSPSPKKQKGYKEQQNRSDASIQAEFCRAVTELQITGLLRMPSKRRPDFVQRVAFGF